jgi:hypothetical protein
MNHQMIELSDTPLTAIAKIAENNAGAVTVLADLFITAASIDPDSALAGMGPIFQFETLEIYGSKVWSFYKECCGSNILGMQAVLRANQLGIISRTEINQAIQNCTRLDTTAVLKAVQSRLPAFGVNDGRSKGLLTEV